MKRYCKAIDITDRGLISTAVYKCLNKKYKRNDTLRLLGTYTILDVNQIYCILRRYGKKALWFLTEAVIDDIQKEIINWDIKFPPVWYREKIDASSGKIRRIGIQNIKQQIYDYVAVEALQPILKRIGEHQYASIKGRGTLKGARAIRRWLRNRKLIYVAQSDVKKCYESIDREKLMCFLEHYIKNDLLLKLIRKLIYSFEKGLSIGSYLSQFLCNLYMSILYHEVSENMYRIRKHRNGIKERINLVKKKVFYMDDTLLAGTNKKDIKKAMKLFIRKAKELRGSEPGYPNLAEHTGYDIDPKTGQGTVLDPTGLHGYNCRHSHQPWAKGLRNPWEDEHKVESEENKKVYENTQKQRAMERAIRKTKRRLIEKQQILNSDNIPGEVKKDIQAEYDRLAYRLTEQNGAYNSFCKDNNLAAQYDRNKVADFGYSQQSKANAGAKRYMKGH